MDQKIIDFNKSQQSKKMPEIQTGDIVRVHKKIIEGDKERIQVFEGLVIAIKGKQSSSPMITVRRDSKGIGVEITIPIFSPSIEKIEVLRHSKVRRSKLYYMRDRSGKAAKMQAKELTEEEKNQTKALNKKSENKIQETETVKETTKEAPEKKEDKQEAIPITENKKAESKQDENSEKK